jgi:hypothetical protein
MHSFETQPDHRLGLVTRSQVGWVDPGQQKKIQAYHLKNENILDQQIPAKPNSKSNIFFQFKLTI